MTEECRTADTTVAHAARVVAEVVRLRCGDVHLKSHDFGDSSSSHESLNRSAFGDEKHRTVLARISRCLTVDA